MSDEVHDCELHPEEETKINIEDANSVISEKDAKKEMITDFVTAPTKSLHYTMFEKVFGLILDKCLFFADTMDSPPCQFIPPEILLKKFDFKLGSTGTDMETFFEILEQVIKYTPHNAHPYKINGKGCGLDPYGIAGDLLGTAMNSVVLTFLYAPVFTLMEHMIYKRIREIAGYQIKDGDGIMAPDKNMADVMAIGTALHKKFPIIRHFGYIKVTQKPVFFFPKYTKFDKLGHFVRLTGSCAVSVKIDDAGRMSVTNLRAKIRKSLRNNLTPFLVIAVAGSPLCGAIDPLNEIAEVCAEQQIWFHVCVASGGALISDKQRWRLKGIELSDSLSWSADSELAAPFCCNVLVFKKSKMLTNTFALDSPIVFQDTSLYDSKWNTGDRTIQTSRRPDVLKLFLMWKANGQKGLAAHVDLAYKNTSTFVTGMKRRGPTFQLVLDSFDTCKVSFYFIPEDLRHLGSSALVDHTERISNITEAIKADLVTNGIIHIGTSTGIKGYPRCILVTLNNSVLTKKDLVYIIDQIEFVGMKLSSRFGVVKAAPVPPRPDPNSFPPFVSSPIQNLHKEFFQHFFNMIQANGLYFQEPDSDAPPLEFHEPEKLLSLVDLSLGAEPISQEALLEFIAKVIQFSSHQSHQRYFFQLKAGLDPYALAADFVQSAMNCSSNTYEDGPVYTLMENEVIRAVREILGYTKSSGPNDHHNGLIAPGGSMCNIYAQRIALYQSQKVNNWEDDRHFVLYASDAAHYCHEKGAILNGVGEDNCKLIKTNMRHEMIPEKLIEAIEQTLKEGGTPFMVVATMGTTVMGTIDPIDKIADICEHYKLWLHIDGSFGGTLIFSEREMNARKTLKATLARTDSFCFNGHKMLCIPVTSSVLVFREPGILMDAWEMKGEVKDKGMTLYNQEIWDNSNKHWQSERRAEVFKLWTAWKVKGVREMSRHIDTTIDNMRFAVEEMKRRNDKFQVLIPEFDLVCVCFYYIPTSLRGLDRTSQMFKNRIQNVGRVLQSRLVRGNILLLVLEEDKQHPLFIKFNYISSAQNPESIRKILDIVDELGHDIEA